jgi:hypothetical protein
MEEYQDYSEWESELNSENIKNFCYNLDIASVLFALGELKSFLYYISIGYSISDQISLEQLKKISNTIELQQKIIEIHLNKNLCFLN